jgi:hypothetical protein
MWVDKENIASRPMNLGKRFGKSLGVKLAS